MSTVNHGGAVYEGTAAERIALATSGLKVGTVWVETDTELVRFWTGALWARTGASEMPQAHIIDADGTLADITTKFNTLLLELETMGIIADA